MKENLSLKFEKLYFTEEILANPSLYKYNFIGLTPVINP
jgi:hypothetical protein